MSLCYRCEHRAMFLEKNYRPRCECGDVQKSVYSCYMYQPVKPARTAKDKNDKRPQFGPWMISARSHFVDVPPVKLKLDYDKKDGSTMYWVPEKKVNKSKKKKVNVNHN